MSTKVQGKRIRRVDVPAGVFSADLPKADEAGYVDFDGDRWFRVENAQSLPEFFTMPVSSGDHWMFVSSRGALSAGRRNPDSALFPYYSCDKISDTSRFSGSLTIVRVVNQDGSVGIWTPFQTSEFQPRLPSNVYKNVAGNKILFEEVNAGLGLVFRYQWSFGDKFGFVRTCEIVNVSGRERQISLVDGLQNVLPAGLSQEFQMRYSNLGNAYKKQEKLKDSSLCLYYLSSIPTDEAMPSEGLKATAVWSVGLPGCQVLLSTDQLSQFADSGVVQEEEVKRGCRGAYLLESSFALPVSDSLSWQVVADVEQEHADVIRVERMLRQASDRAVKQMLADDVAECQVRLDQIVSSADGVQGSLDDRRVHRHRSNVTYNVMRGGLPANNYRIRVDNFASYVAERNKGVFKQFESKIRGLGDEVSLQQLHDFLDETADQNLSRLGGEYLPFTFGRRHGDPSRPWNRFTIETKNADGSRRIAYAGNWRDIFQNWEAIAISWPEYTNCMVRKFVNASTADGYNPYRINQTGVDWEVPSEDEFSNIGYWGDHQIIYLSKLLEWSRATDPVAASRLLEEENCSYSNVPYRIANYSSMLKDASNTITFDDELNRRIDDLQPSMGTDAKLHLNDAGEVHHVAMLEKLLLPAVVKMTNFVPGGGVWLNTQRPEWNDANNALVGRGVSTVTACYLHRFFVELKKWLSEYQSQNGDREFKISGNVWQLVDRVASVLKETQARYSEPLSDCQRKMVVDQLSTAGSDYREVLYRDGVGGEKVGVKLDACVAAIDACIVSLRNCVEQSHRPDGLYDAYYLLHFSGDELSLERLDEMLEGQVAAISSGVLSSEECCEALDRLRNSRLFREDQQSFMLYPNRVLPNFMEKNFVDAQVLESSALLQALVAENDHSIVRMNLSGNLNFNGDFRNAHDLRGALDRLARRNDSYRDLVLRDREAIEDLYESTFQHRKFTGRSGTFFAYEGLGSIYWHMVSKLSLAVAEQYVVESRTTKNMSVMERLGAHYFQILEGIGAHKSAADYGAFPIDAYSHTPENSGAKQPGMTGQVKEDVISRLLEIGARVSGGRVEFDPSLFDRKEFATHETAFEFTSLDETTTRIKLPVGSFAWTWCQTPIVYRKSDQNRLVATFASGEQVERNTLELTNEESQQLFARSSSIKQIDVYFAGEQVVLESVSKNGSTGNGEVK